MIEGKKLSEVDLMNLFRPVDGEINLYYGRIGMGKTYTATADVLDDLKKGIVVYVNWPIEFEGYDERSSFKHLIASLLFPFVKTKFKVIPKTNLKMIKVDEYFAENFQKLRNCKVYLDEGHTAFDSYEMAKMSMDKRVAILHTRHFDRTIQIISQRPTAIHTVMRDNVNRFYKFQRFGKKPPFMFFKRTEYQDMKDGTVDEEADSVSVKLYLPSKKVLNAYNTKYIGGDPQYKPTYELYKMNYLIRILALLKLIFIAPFAHFTRARGAKK
jgi:hypothetical protein